MKEIKRIEEKIKELERKKEALIIAIPKEESSHQFYQALANSTEKGGTKEMFIMLANLEVDHKQILEKMIKEMQESIDKLKAEKERLLGK
jgi:rubrerythrin